MSVTIDGTNGVTASASFYGQSTFTGTYTDGIVVDYTTGTGRITVGSSDGLKIRNGGTASPTDLVTVDSSGNVGIGTSSPISKLHVNSSGSTVTYVTVGNSNGGTQLGVDASGNSIVSAYSTSPILFGNSSGTTFAEKARIDSSGNLLVGTTSTSVASGGFAIQPASGESYINIGHKTGTSSGAYFLPFSYNGTIIGGVTQNGTTAVAYNTTSDYRLKENVQPLSGALTRVAALKPCTYTWKSAPDEIGEGFIAHELAEVCPQAVTGEKDAVNEDGSIKPQSIDTSFLVATLTAAIQELNAKVEALEAQLKAA